MLQFSENGKMRVNQSGETSEVKFTFKDSILVIGSRSYTVIELSVEELILEEKASFLPTVFRYKKTDKQTE